MGAGRSVDSSEPGQRSKSKQTRTPSGDGDNDVVTTRLRGHGDPRTKSFRRRRRLGRGVERWVPGEATRQVIGYRSHNGASVHRHENLNGRKHRGEHHEGPEDGRDETGSSLEPMC